ncbi:MAG: hypothetical protein KY444_12695, partial [Gemmatimonadetes bacterium]|nr:hypothetical protein [Gemmatimonadota bacterium]
MLATHDLEHHVPTRLPLVPALPAVRSTPDSADTPRLSAANDATARTTYSDHARAEAWTVAQAAVIAHAEAIAAQAATEVAAEAAVTALAAVDAASAAALRAIGRAEAVAARASLAAEAAAQEMLLPHPSGRAEPPSEQRSALLLPRSGVASVGGAGGEGAASSAAAATAAATAAARVASRVAAVAAAAAVAAVQAETLVRDQLVQDESAMALQLLAGALHADTPRPTPSALLHPGVVAEELRYGISA